MAEAAVYSGKESYRIGDVYSKTFSVFIRNIVIFSVITGLLWLPVELISYWAELNVDKEIDTIAIAGVVVVITLIFPLAVAILVHATYQVLLNQPLSIVASIGHSLKRFPQVVAVSCLMTLGGLAGIMLLVIPGFILITMWYVAIPICVIEKCGPLTSLNRSADLTKGYRWQIFSTFFIAYFVGGIIDSVFEVDLILTTISNTKIIVLIIWGGIYQAFLAVMTAVMYHNLRIAKEGTNSGQISNVFK